MLSNTYQCVSYSRRVRRRVEGPVEVVHTAVDGTPRRETGLLAPVDAVGEGDDGAVLADDHRKRVRYRIT